eukprot:GFYU01014059.1.p1 GENE.GFYU01014059.1~~GFYU01014059.1.p1  ORF type:complete len:494 (+),score=80.73 GFYU01014059.1:125-1606(+)
MSLCGDGHEIHTTHGSVTGLANVRGRLEGEISVLESLCRQGKIPDHVQAMLSESVLDIQAAASHAPTLDLLCQHLHILLQPLLPLLSETTDSRVEGLLNNLRGIYAEVSVAAAVPALTALSKNMLCDHPLSTGDNTNAGVKLKHPKTVVVDVVCNYGMTWIEVKDVKHITRGGSEWDALVTQLVQYTTAASDHRNQTYWCRPTVVLCYTHECDIECIDELQRHSIIAVHIDELRQSANRVRVRGRPSPSPYVYDYAPPPQSQPDFESGRCVPQLSDSSVGNVTEDMNVFPPLPVMEEIHVDVSTMIVLVSEVANDCNGRHHEHITTWSSQSQLWTEGVALEMSAPGEMLREILSVLRVSLKDSSEDRIPPEHIGTDIDVQCYDVNPNGPRIVACTDAIDGFEEILNTVGGPREKSRWYKCWKPLITVVPSVDSPRITKCRKLKMSSRHKCVFGTGDAHRALTLTANASFVRRAEAQSIWLNVRLHRPQWLCGV